MRGRIEKAHEAPKKKAYVTDETYDIKLSSHEERKFVSEITEWADEKKPAFQKMYFRLKGCSEELARYFGLHNTCWKSSLYEQNSFETVFHVSSPRQELHGSFSIQYRHVTEDEDLASGRRIPVML